MAFPGSIPSYTGFTAGHTLLTDVHASQHNLEQADISAIATKVGTGASTPTNHTVLKGNGVGTTTWGQVDLTADITGVLPIANTNTSSILQLVYPVGSIYLNATDATNPGTLLGFGTWSQAARGRVLVGEGTSDQAFNISTTGGESNHALVTSEIPAHTHTQDAHTHSLSTSSGSGVTAGGVNALAGNNSSNSGSTTATNQNTGGSGTHNNLQPYLTVYIWQRTA